MKHLIEMLIDAKYRFCEKYATAIVMVEMVINVIELFTLLYIGVYIIRLLHT